jgi:hypothetical protein
MGTSVYRASCTAGSFEGIFFSTAIDLALANGKGASLVLLFLSP